MWTFLGFKIVYKTESIQFSELIATYFIEKKKLKFAMAFKQFYAFICCFSSSEHLINVN